MQSIEQWLRASTAALAATSPSPRRDSELLLMQVCALTRAEIITQAARLLSPQQEEQLRQLLTRRRHGEPVAYLRGRREFWSLELLVSPAALIPRPETELLVEQALKRIPSDTPCLIADLGTGSGAVAVAIAKARPRSRVIAGDISPQALALARQNALRHTLNNIEFRQGDWFAPLSEQADVIVSNPPYLRNDDPHLAAGDLRFEPRLALLGGTDGLDAIRQLAAQAKHHLKAGGWLLLEHGFDQKQAAINLLRQHHYQHIADYRDYSGQDRVIEARFA